MIYYEILRNKKGFYVVMKNIENHGVACKGIFSGLKYECEKYIEAKGIKLGKANARIINSERII